MQVNSPIPIGESPGRPLNPLPTPDVSALDVDDVFGPSTLARATMSMSTVNCYPSGHEAASPAASNISPEGLLADANSGPSEAPEPSQPAPQSQPQNERALALAKLLQPPACAEYFPYALLPPYQPPGPPEMTAANHICPSEGHLPSVVLPMQRALEGISTEQIEGVMASPDDFLVLVFFLGGRNHFNAHKDLLLTTQAKLREIFQDNEITLLASVRSENTPSMPSKFSPPISHFITGLKPHVRTFLLAYKTIGISDTIAFHALALGDNAVSWIVGIYKTPILDEGAAPALIRNVVTKTTFNNTSFRRIIAPTRPPNTHMDAYTAGVLNTVMVRPLSGYKDDIQGKAYIISLAPFTSVTPTFEEAKKHIRMTAFWQGPFKITPAGSSEQSLKLGELVTCGLCKMDTHHSFACPFNTLEGWWGPKWVPKEVPEGPRSDRGTPNNFRGRGNRGRGNRGRGPRGQRGRY